MSNESPAPIALFAYDRPDHLAQVAEALARNPEASESPLFVFLDAPKSDAAAMRVTALRAQARRIEGFKSRQIVEQSTNQGIARSIIQGVTRLTAEFGRFIVLEDDLPPSAHFLRYMNDALKAYDDFDHIKPYQPAGVLMVFGEGVPQVQYPPNKLALRELWFQRAPRRIRFARGRYLSTPSRWTLFAMDTLAAAVFLISARLFGTIDGWVGVFEKTRE